MSNITAPSPLVPQPFLQVHNVTEVPAAEISTIATSVTLSLIALAVLFVNGNHLLFNQKRNLPQMLRNSLWLCSTGLAARILLACFWSQSLVKAQTFLGELPLVLLALSYLSLSFYQEMVTKKVDGASASELNAAQDNMYAQFDIVVSVFVVAGLANIGFVKYFSRSWPFDFAIAVVFSYYLTALTHNLNVLTKANRQLTAKIQKKQEGQKSNLTFSVVIGGTACFLKISELVAKEAIQDSGENALQVTHAQSDRFLLGVTQYLIEILLAIGAFQLSYSFGNLDEMLDKQRKSECKILVQLLETMQANQNIIRAQKAFNSADYEQQYDAIKDACVQTHKRLTFLYTLLTQAKLVLRPGTIEDLTSIEKNIQSILIWREVAVKKCKHFKSENTTARLELSKKCDLMSGNESESESTTDESFALEIKLEKLEEQIISNASQQEELAHELERMQRRVEFNQCELSILQTRLEQFAFKEYEAMMGTFSHVKERTWIIENRTANIRRIGYPRFEEVRLMNIIADVQSLQETFLDAKTDEIMRAKQICQPYFDKKVGTGVKVNGTIKGKCKDKVEVDQNIFDVQFEIDVQTLVQTLILVQRLAAESVYYKEKIYETEDELMNLKCAQTMQDGYEEVDPSWIRSA